MNNKKLILRNRQTRIIYYASVLIALIICWLFSEYKSADIVALVVFGITEIVFIFESPRIVFKYLFFFFGMLANVIGCFFCEFGNFYLVEVSAYSHYVGALPSLVLTQFFFFVCLFESEKKINKRQIKIQIISKGKISEKTICMLNCLVFILYLLIFLHVLPYSAIRLNVDRMTFNSLGYNSGIWRYLSKWAQFFVVIPIGCIAYTNKKKYKAFGIITLIIYCLYCLWIGNKFGSFFSLFCVFCMLNYSRIDIKEKTLKKIFLIVIGIISVLILLAAFIFTKYQNQSSSINAYLQNRLAEQGQLFWRTYEVSEGKYHLSEIGNEIVGQLSGAKSAEELVGAKHGVYHIMYLCAPKQKVDSFILYGSRYTEAGYASAFYYCGILGCLLLASLFAKIIASLTNMVITSTRNNDLLGMILMVRMYFVTCTALSMFLFYDYLTGTSIITYLWCVYLRLGGKKLTFKHKHKMGYALRQ